mgnify:CR=1 FL=1
MTAADLKIGRVGHGARIHRLIVQGDRFGGETLIASCGSRSDKGAKASLTRAVEGKTVADIDCAKCAKSAADFLDHYAAEVSA